MDEFKFPLKAQVTIACSGETGVVIGRAQYVTSENAYFIRYRCADGRAVQQWWDESALT